MQSVTTINNKINEGRARTVYVIINGVLLTIIAVLCVWFAAEIVALFIFGSKKIKFVLDTREEIS